MGNYVNDPRAHFTNGRFVRRLSYAAPQYFGPSTSELARAAVAAATTLASANTTSAVAAPGMGSSVLGAEPSTLSQRYGAPGQLRFLSVFETHSNT